LGSWWSWLVEVKELLHLYGFLNLRFLSKVKRRVKSEEQQEKVTMGRTPQTTLRKIL
jgi:hypothetical protein